MLGEPMARWTHPIKSRFAKRLQNHGIVPSDPLLQKDFEMPKGQSRSNREIKKPKAKKAAPAAAAPSQVGKGFQSIVVPKKKP
jgi:hypothetical protein